MHAYKYESPDLRKSQGKKAIECHFFPCKDNGSVCLTVDSKTYSYCSVYFKIQQGNNSMLIPVWNAENHGKVAGLKMGFVLPAHFWHVSLELSRIDYEEIFKLNKEFMLHFDHKLEGITYLQRYQRYFVNEIGIREKCTYFYTLYHFEGSASRAPKLMHFHSPQLYRHSHTFTVFPQKKKKEKLYAELIQIHKNQ